LTKSSIVNFVSRDPVLREKIRFLSRRQQLLSFTITEEPLVPPGQVDLYVIPSDFFRYSSVPDTLTRLRLPFIAYGPPEDLKSAFLFGCTDYLKDPWSPTELEIRVKKLLGDFKITLPWGALTYSPTILQTDFGQAELTFHEYRIFSLLAREQGTVVPREALFYALLGKPAHGSRAIDMHITNIRKKTRSILPAPEAQIIRSARTMGYFIPG
jgi:hypothetical protein